MNCGISCLIASAASSLHSAACWNIARIRYTVVYTRRDDTLTLTGTGYMPNYPSPSPAPFCTYRNSFSSLSSERALHLSTIMLSIISEAETTRSGMIKNRHESLPRLYSACMHLSDRHCFLCLCRLRRTDLRHHPRGHGSILFLFMPLGCGDSSLPEAQTVFGVIQAETKALPSPLIAAHPPAGNKPINRAQIQRPFFSRNYM